MDFYGINSKGYIKIQRVEVLPTWTSDQEERILHNADDGNLYLGGDIDWINLGEFDASKIISGTLDSARIPNLDADKITSGTISPDRLPSASVPKVVTVADQAARYALTSPANVVYGDTVSQQDTGTLYFVKDVANLGNSNGYNIDRKSVV